MLPRVRDLGARDFANEEKQRHWSVCFKATGFFMTEQEFHQCAVAATATTLLRMKVLAAGISLPKADLSHVGPSLRDSACPSSLSPTHVQCFLFSLVAAGCRASLSGFFPVRGTAAGAVKDLRRNAQGLGLEPISSPHHSLAETTLSSLAHMRGSDRLAI